MYLACFMGASYNCREKCSITRCKCTVLNVVKKKKKKNSCIGIATLYAKVKGKLERESLCLQMTVKLCSKLNSLSSNTHDI